MRWEIENRGWITRSHLLPGWIPLFDRILLYVCITNQSQLENSVVTKSHNKVFTVSRGAQVCIWCRRSGWLEAFSRTKRHICLEKKSSNVTGTKLSKVSALWHCIPCCRACTSIKCMAASLTSLQKNSSMFRMIWANSDSLGITGRRSKTNGNNFPIFIAQNNWPKWTRRVIVWFTIGKSTGLDSFPTGTTVATGVFRCWRILENGDRPLLLSYSPNSGWSRNRNSGLHININRSPRLQGVKGGSQG